MSTVSNLVQNALKFTNPGSHVSLRGRCTDGRLVIEIEDECGGLPPGKIDELFLPFVRGMKARSGIGLGLSIAVRAIRQSTARSAYWTCGQGLVSSPPSCRLCSCSLR
jgi:signal transduction histidine kinase